MKSPALALIDYDMGNLLSVTKALENVGASVKWAQEPSQTKSCDAMVLPGVGSFSVAVKNLKKRKLFDAVKHWIVCGKPFLGICLGYQLLCESSEETDRSGRACEGLAVFNGRVKRFPVKKNLKIPHIGWNQTKQVTGSSGLTAKIFRGIRDGSYFYFVHSYYPDLSGGRFTSTTTEYGVSFSSSICADNLFACQFHPEKSGKNGLQLLKNFAAFI